LNAFHTAFVSLTFKGPSSENVFIGEITQVIIKHNMMVEEKLFKKPFVILILPPGVILA
jgi:hypothetical protein